jgi:hypothetical protein
MKNTWALGEKDKVLGGIVLRHVSIIENFIMRSNFDGEDDDTD